MRQRQLRQRLRNDLLVVHVLELRVAGEPEAEHVPRAVEHLRAVVQVLGASAKGQQPTRSRLYHEVRPLVHPDEPAAVKVGLHRAVVVASARRAGVGMAVAVQVEQCRVVVRRTVRLVDVRIVVPVPRLHIHAIPRHALVRPDACEERASRIEARDAKVGFEGAPHALQHARKQRVPRRAHVPRGRLGFWGEGGLGTLVEETSHRSLNSGDERRLLVLIEEVVAHHAPTGHRPRSVRRWRQRRAPRHRGQA